MEGWIDALCRNVAPNAGCYGRIKFVTGRGKRLVTYLGTWVHTFTRAGTQARIFPVASAPSHQDSLTSPTGQPDSR